jgi:hypothetical protein
VNHFIDNLMPISADMLLVGGRGHGKNAHLAHLRKLEAAMRELYPPVPPAEVIGNLNVRWSCPKPTALPSPAVGTPLWMQDQAHDILQGRKKFGDVIALMKAAGL